MDTTNKTKITLSVTKPELSGLGMLLEWIIDNQKVMDRGSISLKEEEIRPLIHKWLEIVDHNIK